MQLKEKNEKKRSTLWKIVTYGSSIVILVVLAYFLTDMVKGNPLKGEWYAEEKGYYLLLSEDGTMSVKGIFDEQEMTFDLTYSLDKSEKLITIKTGQDDYGYVTSAWTTEETSEAPESTSVTFRYSLGRKTLTLTDREYGVEFVFTRQ